MSSSTTTTATLTKQQKKKLAKKRRKRSRKMNLGMNLEKDVLKPLTPEQKSKAYEVKAAYADWWNNRKFTKGWAQPLFTYQEVEQLLERAAEIVVRIRAHLDEINPGMKLRMTDGSAREFLWGQEEHPSKDPEKFVREIIHATLSDGNGYVEGLTKEKIDQYIETIEKYLAQERAGEIEKLEEDVRRNWNEADTLLKELLSKSAEDKKAPQFVQQLQMILSKLGTLTKDMKEIKKGKDRRSLSLSSSSNTPYGARAAPDTAVVPVTSPDAPTEQVKEAEPAAAPETPPTEEKAAAEPASPAAMEEVPPSPAEPAATDTAPSETPKTEAEGESPMQVEEKEGAAAAAEEDAEKKAAEEKERQERERLEREEKEKAERAAQREQVRQSGMLKIQRVADDVHSLKGQIQGLSEGANVLDIEHLAKEPESSDKLLDKLQKQCLAYSEGLMKDLLTLDTIISEPELEGEASGEGGDEEPATGVRPMRRKQVKEIQTLLQAVDEVNAKLKAMRSRIQQEKKALEEERRKQEAERKQKEEEEKAKQKEQEQEQQQQQQEEASQSEQGESSEEEKPKKPASATSPPKEHRSPLNEKWKDLKLKPKFEVQQQPQAVVLQAYIPGMNEDDISITLGGDERRGHTLTVSGFRCPTPEEEAALRRQLRAYAQRDPYGLYFPRTEPEDILLLRMGAGRYGSFSETFQLGDTMDHENLSAAYNGGILQITIPRKLPARKPRPAIPQRGRPYVPAGYPRQSDGFFNDRSFWW